MARPRRGPHGGLDRGLGQDHGYCASRADGFQALQQRRIAIDLRLGLGAAEAERFGIGENSEVAGVEQGHRQPAQPGDIQLVDQLPAR